MGAPRSRTQEAVCSGWVGTESLAKPGARLPYLVRWLPLSIDDGIRSELWMGPLGPLCGRARHARCARPPDRVSFG
jgi:hypothetical protein